ncbi:MULTISPECIES: hypothetical protein [unclassified Meiothermus]|uniref:hypothetical protein n=1 Tax=unclassified Meiothermus TaxID=370471 RepID=UPI000D7D1528|nr:MULTISPECIES: hypothetical protein [unclassified Meiothermus]PZA08117.1 hypothetical protein DNA98_02920 [Meiothermus sp. Pnk-1]RYM31394.1 hypothetical protein EWH23_14905 [Meiothermus sp. PNK-Is4]
MTYYLMRAKAKGNLAELKRRLDGGEIQVMRMRPFRAALDDSLQGARLEPDGTWVWERQDYCVPPLAMERAAVLDTYFEEIVALSRGASRVVETVQKGQGRKRLEGLPSAWGKQ